MVDVIIALSIVCALLLFVSLYFGVLVFTRCPKRVCDICKTYDDAMSYAISEGLIDCSEFTAKDMANFLLGRL